MSQDQDTLFELPPPSPPRSVFRPEMYRPGSRRPHRVDDVVIRAAAMALARDLIEEHPADFKAEDLDEYAASLYDALDHGDVDGFEIGKRLDSRGWMLDADLIETLDGAGDCLSDAEDEATEAWVIGAGIVPAFAVGDRVLVDDVYSDVETLERKRLVKVGTVEMIVRSIDSKHGTYTVYSLALGHMSDEQLAENERAIAREPGAVWRGGTTGRIFDYERVRRPFCYSCGWPNPGGVCRPAEESA